LVTALTALYKNRPHIIMEAYGSLLDSGSHDRPWGNERKRDEGDEQQIRV